MPLIRRPINLANRKRNRIQKDVSRQRDHERKEIGAPREFNPPVHDQPVVAQNYKLEPIGGGNCPHCVEDHDMKCTNTRGGVQGTQCRHAHRDHVFAGGCKLCACTGYDQRPRRGVKQNEAA